MQPSSLLLSSSTHSPLEFSVYPSSHTHTPFSDIYLFSEHEEQVVKSKQVWQDYSHL